MCNLGGLVAGSGSFIFTFLFFFIVFLPSGRLSLVCSPLSRYENGYFVPKAAIFDLN